MKFANATNLDRKSGVAQWRDLRFLFGSHADVLPTEIHLRNSRAEASPIGIGSASRHMRRGLVALIALFAHFYLANHPPGRPSPQITRPLTRAR
jgi:hypothetical protein